MKTEVTMTIEEANAFLDKVEELEMTEMDERKVAEAVGLTPVEFRQKRAFATRVRLNAKISEAKTLRDGGMSLADIASHLGFDNESSVQELLDTGESERPSSDCIKTEMGRVANLITEMTIRGVTADELNRATAYSMAVIDGRKLGVDYIRESAERNGITDLEAKYQRASI